jgi:hypothetical protein
MIAVKSLSYPNRTYYCFQIAHIDRIPIKRILSPHNWFLVHEPRHSPNSILIDFTAQFFRYSH